MLLKLKEQIGTHISIVVPDGDKFKYQAKTHNLTIPEKQYPFLKKRMATDKIMTKRVLKDNKELITTYGPIKDYSGNIVGILAVPLNITQSIIDAKKSIFKIACIGLAILICSLAWLFFFFQRMVSHPVNILKGKLEKASTGDMTQQIETGQAAQKGKNEFVELGLYFNTLIDSIKKIVHEINKNSNELNQSATVLTSVSTELSQGADQTADRSKNAAKATEEMSANMDLVTATTREASENVQNMISRTEEINSTVNEIKESTGKANKITGQAVDEAVEVSSRMDELSIAAKDIDKVTETIGDISDQINLLALNATIEAVRAGDAGKGFAVVANEIKNLAQEKADAIDEISTRIDGVQKSTSAGVDGIKKITEIIKNIDQIVSNIAGSLDAQSSALTELTDNIQQTGAGISEVASNIEQSSEVAHGITSDVDNVNTAALELSKGSTDVQQSAGELKQLSEDLQGMVRRFKLQ